MLSNQLVSGETLNTLFFSSLINVSLTSSKGVRSTSTSLSRHPSSLPFSSLNLAPSSVVLLPTPKPSSLAVPLLVLAAQVSVLELTLSSVLLLLLRNDLPLLVLSAPPTVLPQLLVLFWVVPSPITSLGDGVSTSTSPSEVSLPVSSSCSSRLLELLFPSRLLFSRSSFRWIPSVSF